MCSVIQDAGVLKLSVMREFGIDRNSIVGINVIEFTLSAFVDQDVPRMIGLGLIEVLTILSVDSRSRDILDHEGFYDCEDWLSQFVHPTIVKNALGEARSDTANPMSFQHFESTKTSGSHTSEAKRDYEKENWDKCLRGLTVGQLQVLAEVLAWAYRQAKRFEIDYMPRDLRPTPFELRSVSLCS